MSTPQRKDLLSTMLAPKPTAELVYIDGQPIALVAPREDQLLEIYESKKRTDVEKSWMLVMDVAHHVRTHGDDDQPLLDANGDPEFEPGDYVFAGQQHLETLCKLPMGSPAHKLRDLVNKFVEKVSNTEGKDQPGDGLRTSKSPPEPVEQ